MAATDVQPKTYYHDRTRADMERHLAMPTWTIRQKMALACRILAADGHESGLAGQFSVRGQQPGTYWMLGFGLGFDEANASNIVLCDHELRVLEGTGMVNGANQFHLWIYRERQDVNCIVHTHPPHASALSMIGTPLVVAHMDTAVFHEDCAYLAEWPGLPIGDDEGRIIHAALGNKRAALLAHHGLLAVASTVEEASMLALFLERAARWQLLAQAAGEVKRIKPELAREAHDWRLQPKLIGAQFHYYARRVLKAGDECLR
jgi:L-fuculose-phosphate aldolase